MIKFIHTGDVHLGAQLNYGKYNMILGKDRRDDLLSTFLDIIKLAKEEDVDFIFISGDLYESKFFTLSQLNNILNIMKSADNIKIFIVSGNHDPIMENSIWMSAEIPENVYLFTEQKLKYKEISDKNVRIYGYSWKDYINKDVNLFDDISLDKNYKNFLLLHGDLNNPSSEYLPLKLEDLQKSDFDYIALGHIHKSMFYASNICYCGSPEPLDFGETGMHGIIYGEMDSKLKLTFRDISKGIFINGEVKIDENINYLTLKDMILKRYKNKNKKVFLKLTLTGFIDESNRFDLDILQKDLEQYFEYLEIEDDTTVNFDIETIKASNVGNIVGKFVEKMEKLGLENETNRKALYLGLEALLLKR